MTGMLSVRRDSVDELPMMIPLPIADDGSVDPLPMMDYRESSYKYAAWRRHELGITPHRAVKTLHLGIGHQRIGGQSRSESRVCTYPSESGRTTFSL
jgi:hypothetical protein